MCFMHVCAKLVILLLRVCLLPSILLFPIMFMILLSPIADDSPGDDFIKRISVFLGPRLMHLSGEVRDFITRNRSQR